MATVATRLESTRNNRLPATTFNGYGLHKLAASALPPWRFRRCGGDLPGWSSAWLTFRDGASEALRSALLELLQFRVNFIDHSLQSRYLFGFVHLLFGPCQLLPQFLQALVEQVNAYLRLLIHASRCRS